MLYFRKLLEAIGLFSAAIIIVSFLLVHKITKENPSDIKDHYDAIIILSGNPERAFRASKLFFEKNSKIIFLSKEQVVFKNYFEPNNSKKTYELYLDILIKSGVDPKNIRLFGINNKSTIDEINELSRLDMSEYRDILIVTDRYHVFRANQILKDFNVKFNYDFYIALHSANWYENKGSILIVFSELLKTYLYYIFEDFSSYKQYIAE
ncbi:MAG: ElyC/SanA/YdcF family protein [Gammaproteobacteria bacterium]